MTDQQIEKLVTWAGRIALAILAITAIVAIVGELA